MVQITATYRGGNSQDLEKTVAQPIEQQLVGLDGMLYFFSRSSNDGVMTIDVTYELGTDIDLATVKTQNKVNIAVPILPPEVQRQGVTVKKVSSAFLMAISVTAAEGLYDDLFLNNYSTINLADRSAVSRAWVIRVSPPTRATGCASGRIPTRWRSWVLPPPTLPMRFWRKTV